MLEVRALSAWYGQAQALHELSLSVANAETVVLLGRNGAGKSTTLKAIAGMLRPVRGEVRFAGERIDELASWRIARLGLGYVPERPAVQVAAVAPAPVVAPARPQGRDRRSRRERENDDLAATTSAAPARTSRPAIA